jgi:ATP adenylyltransferase
MDRLWTPWRYQYISAAGEATGCIFCEKPAQGADEENYIVHRSRHNYVILNAFPYTSGHVMVAPYKHVATLDDAGDETLLEMMLLVRGAVSCLKAVYRPDGVNLGMNLGKAAGAGVAGHIHMHVLPRWMGDANFMTTVAETRVIPEDLNETYRKLKQAFDTADMRQ